MKAEENVLDKGKSFSRVLHEPFSEGIALVVDLIKGVTVCPVSTYYSVLRKAV